MSTIPGTAESTYKMCYRGGVAPLTYIKYKTLPCMHPAQSKMREGEQGLFGLKRVCHPVPQPPASPAPNKPRPVPAVRLPVTRTGLRNKVIDTKFGPMDQETMDTLYNKYRYTTFTQKAGAECDMQLEKPEPPASLDPKADMVRLYAKRYETSSEDWQDAVLWDRLQSRYPTNRPKSPIKKKLLNSRLITNCLDDGRQNRIRKLVQTDGLANVFVRKCPGYAGYNPLCPPETRLDDKKNPPEWSTVMSVSYRKFPDHMYDKQSFARQGQFSQTVTLTYPFNPFNKVGEEVNTEKTGLYSTNGNFMGLIG